jgi:hypothetical protein
LRLQQYCYSSKVAKAHGKLVPVVLSTQIYRSPLSTQFDTVLFPHTISNIVNMHRVDELIDVIGFCFKIPATLRDLFRMDDHLFRSELLQMADSWMIYQAWKLTEPELQAKLPNTVRTIKRVAVVRDMSDHEQNEALKRLESWQEQEAWNWSERIMDKYIMTGVLPAHYHRKGLHKCMVCRTEYSTWESVNTADCWNHTCSDVCDVPDGICVVCN